MRLPITLWSEKKTKKTGKKDLCDVKMTITLPQKSA